jgi:hypothetical protein
MQRKNVLCYGALLLLMCFANVSRRWGWAVTPDNVTTKSMVLPRDMHIPGGFAVKGRCNLEQIKYEKKTVELGVFVKHGLHSTKNLIPKECPFLESHWVTFPEEGMYESPWYPKMDSE